MIEERLRSVIREVPDYPSQGVVFRDLTPLFKQPTMCDEIIDLIANWASVLKVTAVAGIESRGFFLAPSIAFRMGITFVPIRKKGKLPFTTHKEEYHLEYGNDVLEVHTDAFSPADNVLIHDDVLATGGTALAASRLVEKCGGRVAGYSFLLELSDLKGRDRIPSQNIHKLITY